MPALADIVPVPVKAMPRFELMVVEAVTSSVPPPKVSWPAVGEPGAVPRSLSAPMLSVPAVTVVAPVKVLAPSHDRARADLGEGAAAGDDAAVRERDRAWSRTCRRP